MATKALVRRPKGGGIEKRWWIVGLALFLVFDVVLVAGALNANRAQNDGGTIAVPSSSASSSTTPPVVSVAVPPQRVLVSVSGEMPSLGPTELSEPGDGALSPWPGGFFARSIDGGLTWN